MIHKMPFAKCEARRVVRRQRMEQARGGVYGVGDPWPSSRVEEARLGQACGGFFLQEHPSLSRKHTAKVGISQQPGGTSAVPGEAPEEGPLGPGPLSQGLPPSTTSPPGGRGPSHDPASPLFDFEAYYSDIQEAIPSRGRQPGSRQSLVGRAQLYLTINRTPSNVACQVQPHQGLEAHTIFSVFCMSGRPDFLYKFSYQIGNVSKHTLYYGRDAQLYFALPAGEPSDGYKVLVSTEITDREGSKARPCAVAVTVLPRYRGDDCPAGEELYNSSLKNLATLQLMGSYAEVRNYITMIASILSRLTKEDRSDSCSQWSQIQDALISSVCRLAFADQDEMTDSVLMLKGLINSPNKLSFDSAVLILKYSRTLLAPGQLSGRCVVDKGLRLELILLIARVWEASEQEKSREEDYLREEGIEIISNLLLSCLSSHPERRLYVRTGRMEFWTLLHQNFQSSVQNLSSIQVHLPGDLTGHSPEEVKTQSPCYISRLILFKKNPYPGRQAAGQIDGVVRLTIFSCSSRRPINRQRLKTRVIVESGEEDDRDNSKNKTTFSLLREKVNFHQFIGLSENSQESLQIRIKFSKPNVKAFPIMLLVRFFKKPTPSNFLVKQIYSWDEQTVYISVPAVSWKDADVGYLSLLDADYDRTPPNKHLAETVNYTVHFQWTRCLFWEQREWKSGSFPPQPGSSPGRVSCSYDRLTAFSVLRRGLNASVEVSDIATLRRHPQNLFPSVFVMVSVIVYGLLVIKCRHADRHEEKKTGYIFLHGDALPDRQLYAVVVDTGFRTPARLTSKGVEGGTENGSGDLTVHLSAVTVDPI
ncbi:polycystic kidney disease protein 1-like 1 [Tupaia chinensis]|uniref:polycystic kidney disease protein 1-like 1 n=1 Tax=Tupaia chinensis TaxID=246437 RepID=UPI000FFB4863|nr:polycystic kidney disease protein 1-like 1 [Tupaia chinensis]